MTTAIRSTSRAASRPVKIDRSTQETPDFGLEQEIGRILGRRPSVGLAVGVVRDGRFEVHGRGLADIAAAVPVTEDTVFRVGSITKLFTAVAILQLWEQRLVDLDAPASDYLRAYPLVPAQAGWRPATLRHLLTHTAGIPEVRGVADLLQSDLTPSGGRPAHLSVRFGEPLPSLAEYYREGLPIVVEPGTAFAYTNHGFATLGQIVEDVSDLPLERFFRERIFQPLGMDSTDLVRSERLASRLATGYAFGRSGPTPVTDRDWTGRGAGAVYSTCGDIARFAVAMLAGGANEHGSALLPATLARMFEPSYQPDPRVCGVGLGFFRGEIDGHRTVGHDGILPGFNSILLLAPDDGVGVLAFTNGGAGAVSWLQIEADRLLRRLLGISEAIEHRTVPHHPEIWPDLCGRYVLQPRIGDLRGRLVLSAGVQVYVTGGRLKVRLLTPVPVPFGGLLLEPDDANDPCVFRLDLSRFGMAPLRVVFSRVEGARATAAHIDLMGQPWSLVRPGHPGTPPRWRGPLLAAAAGAGLLAVAGRRRRRGTDPA